MRHRVSPEFYYIAELCTNVVHYWEKFGTGPVVIKVARWMQALEQVTFARLFPHPVLANSRVYLCVAILNRQLQNQEQLLRKTSIYLQSVSSSLSRGEGRVYQSPLHGRFLPVSIISATTSLKRSFLYARSPLDLRSFIPLTSDINVVIFLGLTFFLFAPSLSLIRCDFAIVDSTTG